MIEAGAKMPSFSLADPERGGENLCRPGRAQGLGSVHLFSGQHPAAARPSPRNSRPCWPGSKNWVSTWPG